MQSNFWYNSRFSTIPCNCQPYFLEIWLLQDRNHSTLSSRYHWEYGQTVRSWRVVHLWTGENTLLDFCNTYSWEFVGEKGPTQTLALSNSSSLVPVSCAGKVAKCCWGLPAVDPVYCFSQFQWLSGRPAPVLVMGSFCSTVPYTQETANLRVALLQFKHYSNNFQVPIKLPLLFLVVYAVQKLHVVMSPYWLHGQLEFDGSMLPLWSGTAFRLNFVKSKNSGHSSGL